MIKTKWILTLLIALPVLLAGCTPAEPSALSDEEILTFASNLLVSMNEDDYASFITDFSEDMLVAFPESEFANLRELVLDASGSFVSADELELTNNQEYAVYRIRCSYSLEDVMVTLVFKVDGTQVEGLFFDSTNMRAASK